MKRVVVTGMAAITPLGNDWETVAQKLKAQTTGIQRMDDWAKYKGLNTHLGAPVNFSRPKHYSRKQVRGMGRVAMLGTYASELALIDAGLLDDPCLMSGQVGVSYGSSSGSFDGLIDFTKMLLNYDKGGMNATSYIRMMGHTCPVNISLHFGINGRIIPTSSACTSTGHTLGACGAIEAWAALHMMNEGWFHPTANLENIDPACAELDYIKGDIRKMDCEYLMSNNFAFGGINTSLIFKRV